MTHEVLEKIRPADLNKVANDLAILGIDLDAVIVGDELRELSFRNLATGKKICSVTKAGQYSETIAVYVSKPMKRKAWVLYHQMSDGTENTVRILDSETEAIDAKYKIEADFASGSLKIKEIEVEL